MLHGTHVETREDARDSNDESKGDLPTPGVAVIFETSATWRAAPAGAAPLLIGRAPENGIVLTDDLASREHVSVTYERGEWTVTDLGSRNGTFLDGKRLDGAVTGPWRCLRVGQTLLVPIDDVRRAPVRVVDARVTGAKLEAALQRVRVAAESGRTLTLIGESGTGKELAAKLYHQASRPHGPLMSVNCAAIPHGVAERLLYGVKRGAYSDARENAEGYFQAADGGVLFLDEVGELALEVQAKLLRTIETGAVLPLGATEAEHVNVLVCCATNRDLSAAVTKGEFRADLYYRIVEAQVQVPPLRTRAEEIPWHIERELGRLGQVTASARFIEACVLREWPGNVRELLAEVRAALDEAVLGKSAVLRSTHLRPGAGERKSLVADEPKPAATSRGVTKEQLLAALDANGGTIAAAARALGLHRTQVYRLMSDFGLKTDK